MTLGGLALAVGILVDDATVTIENINCHLEHGEDVEEAILMARTRSPLPALVSTLAICIVFVPMFMLAGIARYLFVPLAEAVVFAMLASYLLSRTLVPTLAKYWLQQARPACRAPARPAPQRAAAALRARLRAPARALSRAARARAGAGRRFALLFLGAMAATALLAFPFGRYLPGWDRTSSRAWTPGRSSCTCARRPASASRRPRRCATRWRRHPRGDPADEITTIVDNIGVPYSGINLSYCNLRTGRPGRCRHPGHR